MSINKTPKFRLFRLVKPMTNGCTHAGEVWIGGRCWTFTCRVVDTPDGKQFHGDVEAPGASIRQKAFPGTGQPDLVSQAEARASSALPEGAAPFNDSLEGIGR